MSQEIENNFEERKKDWDLTGLLDDVIRRYIYQLTNDELNEINLEKASGMPDEEIKNGIKLPLATMQQRRETWGSQSKLDVQEPMIFILQSTVEKLSVGDKIPLSDADSFLIHQESGVLNYELHYLMNGTPQEYNAFLDLSKVKVADTLMDGVTHSTPPALSDYLERHQQLNDTELGAKRLQKLNCDSKNVSYASLALGDASEDNEQLEQFLDILDERGVNYSVLPDLKYGDNHIQIAVANQSLQQFAAAIKAYLEEFPDAAKDLVEDITEQEYFDSGRMSEEDYMKTASPEIKEKTDPKNWQKGKNLNAQSFEQALAGKEVDRYETLKNRPGLIERYIPSQRVAARREDEIALQTGDREYVRIQEALSVDNGKGFIIFLDPEKNYNVYRPDEKGILQTPSGSLSGKEFSKYTEQSDEDYF